MSPRADGENTAHHPTRPTGPTSRALRLRRIVAHSTIISVGGLRQRPLRKSRFATVDMQGSRVNQRFSIAAVLLAITTAVLPSVRMATAGELRAECLITAPCDDAASEQGVPSKTWSNSPCGAEFGPVLDFDGCDLAADSLSSGSRSCFFHTAWAAMPPVSKPLFLLLRRLLI